MLTFIDVPARVLIEGHETDDRYDLVELTHPPGHMPPLHVHHEQEECWHVLEGELKLLTPGDEVTLGPGQSYTAPRGIPHAYEVGNSPARVLVSSRPAGFERFVSAVGALDEVNPEVLGAVAAEHAIEILGPPGTRP
jgi:mannose-6-phosphate isomerase-like protein (cupin superfamily)